MQAFVFGRQIKICNKPDQIPLYYSFNLGLDKNQIQRLARFDFIRAHKDLFITGSTATSKSYLATALAYQAACQNRYKYAKTAKLMGQLKLVKAKDYADRKFTSYINNIKRI